MRIGAARSFDVMEGGKENAAVSNNSPANVGGATKEDAAADGGAEGNKMSIEAFDIGRQLGRGKYGVHVRAVPAFGCLLFGWEARWFDGERVGVSVGWLVGSSVGRKPCTFAVVVSVSHHPLKCASSTLCGGNNNKQNTQARCTWRA